MRQRIIGIFAILGLLVHVTAWAHHAAMGAVTLSSPDASALAETGAAGPPSLESQFARALLIICHAGTQGQAGTVDQSQDGAGPKAPAGKLKPCPLCSLAQIAAAAPPSDLGLVPVLLAVRVETSFLHADQRREYQRKIRPPGRAPPASLA